MRREPNGSGARERERGRERESVSTSHDQQAYLMPYKLRNQHIPRRGGTTSRNLAFPDSCRTIVRATTQ